VLDSTVALAAAATATRTIRLGYGVYLLAMRNTALAAKQIASLQVISGDRVTLGVGVGGEEPGEWWLAGTDPSTRGARTDDALGRLMDLIRGESVRVPETGDHLRLEPPATVPPVWIGGRSSSALKRAVRFGDAWMAAFCSRSAFQRGRESLNEWSEAVGRIPPSAALTIFTHVSSNRAEAEAEVGAAAKAQYGLDYERMERFSAIGDVDEVAQQLSGFIDAGVDEFACLPLASRWFDQMDRLAEVRRTLGGNR